MARSEQEMTPLDSSAVKGFSYDADARKLRIKFPNGSVHEYDDVSPEKVHTLAGSDSAGRYFNEKIRPHHESRKVG